MERYSEKNLSRSPRHVIQSNEIIKAGCYQISRDAIQKINVSFFDKSDETLRAAGQNSIEEEIGGRIAARWITENDQFRIVYCSRMYEFYCEPLNSIIKECH